MKTSFPSLPLVRICAIALLTTIAATADAATGDVTRGAVAVTTTMGSSKYPVSHLIDQSGLSTQYVSGVTAFDAFATSAKHNSSLAANVWGSDSIKTGFLSFDLGASYTIDGLAWFGLNVGTANVTGIKVYADDDSDATNGHGGLLFDSGTFGSPVTVDGLIAPRLFSFSSAADTRYLDIEIVSNAGYASSGLGEVVFRESLAAPVAAVPEPGTYALMGLGLLAIGYTQRRRVAPR